MRIRARRIAAIGLAIFALILVVQHALAPELEPSRHTISEYVNVPAGPLMILGFLAWAVSLAATALLARSHGLFRGYGERLLVGMLVLAACGLILTAIFPTQTSAGVLPAGIERSTTGRLHDAASGVAILVLFAAAGTSALTARRAATRRVSTVLVVAAVAANSALLLVGPEEDGLRQRLLVGIALIWQTSLLAGAAQPASQRRRTRVRVRAR